MNEEVWNTFTELYKTVERDRERVAELEERVERLTRELSVIRIPLSRGKITLIDAEDLDHIKPYTWHAHYQHGKWYAVGSDGHGRRPVRAGTAAQACMLDLRAATGIDRSQAGGMCRPTPEWRRPATLRVRQTSSRSAASGSGLAVRLCDAVEQLVGRARVVRARDVGQRDEADQALVRVDDGQPAHTEFGHVARDRDDVVVGAAVLDALGHHVAQTALIGGREILLDFRSPLVFQTVHRERLHLDRQTFDHVHDQIVAPSENAIEPSVNASGGRIVRNKSPVFASQR